MFNRYGQVQDQSQIAPGRDLSDVSQPAGAPGRPRKAQANIGQAIQGGIPMGGVSQFAGAAQTTGNPMASPTSTQTAQATPAVTDAQKQAARAQLMANGFGGQLDGGAFKIDDAAHGQKSPKYEFAQTAMNLGLQGKTSDLPTLLSALQQQNPTRWGGWTVNGGDLEYKGDPSQLDKAFEGGTSVDAVLGAKDGGRGFWWGGDQGGPAQQASPVIQNAILGASPTVQVGDFGALRQQIMKALQVDPQLAALGSQFS